LVPAKEDKEHLS